jgi:fructose-bisphosphate aldolase class II
MIKPGVATGDQVQAIFQLAKQKGFALPAVNVTSSSTVNAVMETAAKLNAPVIIQFSNGGGQFFAGKGLSNQDEKAAILGSISGARHVHALAEAYGATVILHTDHCAKKLLPWIDGLLEAGEAFYQETGKPLYSSHMIDLSEEPLAENLEICQHYLRRMSKMGMTLEIELGITGGEEDGVDNSDVDNAKLYTQPEEVAAAYHYSQKFSGLYPRAISNGSESCRLRISWRFRFKSRRDQRSDWLWCGQNEHRYRPTICIYRRGSRLHRSKFGVPSYTNWQPKGRR